MRVLRVLLAGSTAERTKLKDAIAGMAVEVVGEFATVGAARASGTAADAVLSSPDRVPVFDLTEPVEPLTRRELDVLDLLAEGLPNKVIADRLGISDQTVKFHVASIYAKLGAANRTDAVRRAVRRGLLTL
jgi:DNA-binding NarL/FixJ family response regulator